MAPITQLSLLALASAVLAVPHAHEGHFKRHAHPGAPPAYGGAPPAYGASTSSAAPVASSAPPSYGSSAPPAYGSSSSAAAPVSSSAIAGYGSSSSVAAAASSSGIAGYGSSSYAGPASSSGIAGYGSSSVAGPASSSGIAGYGSSSYAGAASSSGLASYGSSFAVSSGYAGPTGGYAHPTGSYGWGSTGVAQPTGSYSGPVSYSTCTETSTLIYRSTTEYSTYYVTHTVYPSGSASAPGSYPSAPAAPAGSSPAGSAPAGYPSGAPVSPASSGSPVGSAPAGTCVPDVTVTKTEKSTIYVTAGGSSAATPTFPASWEPAPTPSSKPAATPSNTYPASWEPAPTPSAAPSTYAPAPSSPAPAPSSPPAYTSAPSSPAPAPSQSASPPNAGSSGYAGKRGLAYNDASLTNMFANSSYVGWAYNWESDSKGLNSGVPYIPTLWGTDSMWTSIWDTNAQTALNNGAKYFFSFNEPDMPTQANLSPQAAADAWRTYMEPYAGKVKLVAPGVTNGQTAGLGLSWLQSFLSACSDCTIDAVAQHWYWNSNDAQMFKTQIQNTIDTIGKPIWVNEFAGVGTDQEKATFLQDVMSWMDSNNDVLGYSYFMVSQGLLCNGNAPSAYGAVYANGS